MRRIVSIYMFVLACFFLAPSSSFSNALIGKGNGKTKQPNESMVSDSSSPALNNKSFTLFALGAESLTYTEEMLHVSGLLLSTETTVTNFIQRSGGYTPVSDRSGFYLKTASTLIGESNSEEWELQTKGVIQTDEMKASVAELEILGAHHLSLGHGQHVVIGLNTFVVNFSRTDFSTSSLVQEQPLGAVSEDAFSLTGLVGYRYDSFFYKPDAPLRLWAALQAGCPLYYRVYNSGTAVIDRDTGGISLQKPVTLTRTLGGGFDILSEVGAGYRLTNNFTMNFSVEASYRERHLIHEGGFTVPDTQLTTVRGLFGIFWTF